MKLKKIIMTLIGSVAIGQAIAASEGNSYPDQPFYADIHNQESLQRGAKYFVNYCSGCHSLEYQRYNRTFKDLGIDPSIGKDTLIFTGAKDVNQMHIAMTSEEGSKWFGKAPPDLSLMARAKGGKYIYNYLQGFYIDDSRPLGFNNSVFAGASMPNPLWQLQGLQKPIYEEHKNCEGSDCEVTKILTGFEPITKGTMTPVEYQQVTYDLTNFLTYVADPSALQRAKLGPWVLIFIALLTVIFYLLKHEYWRDVHPKH
ncbi:cytochrome c1 [Suttonella ornithocola]|uniref:Cytochrome c1 n=1 Tax=Suttonella ornithocola TaxID=279832 RepID=A0A380MXG3_9GAMM|nr:cytochrome c1 [Suttonella ornithocola]SUO97265.1 Cytochrome c1 precursor [Suttonella ornithocola]